MSDTIYLLAVEFSGGSGEYEYQKRFTDRDDAVKEGQRLLDQNNEARRFTVQMTVINKCVWSSTNVHSESNWQCHARP